MSTEEWWAAERKAAEFWRKVREHQQSVHGGNRLYYGEDAAPTGENGEIGPPTRRQFPDIQQLCANL